MVRTGIISVITAVTLLLSVGEPRAGIVPEKDDFRAGLSPDGSHCVILDMNRVEKANDWQWYVGKVDGSTWLRAVDTIYTSSPMTWCDSHVLFWMEFDPDRGAAATETPGVLIVTYDAVERKVDTIASLRHDGATDAYGAFGKQSFRLADSIFCFQTYRADHRWRSIITRVTPTGTLDTIHIFRDYGVPSFCKGFKKIYITYGVENPSWPNHKGVAVIEPHTGRQRHRFDHPDLSLTEVQFGTADQHAFCLARDSLDRPRGIVRFYESTPQLDTVWLDPWPGQIDRWYIVGDSLHIHRIDKTGQSPAIVPTEVVIAVN